MVLCRVELRQYNLPKLHLQDQFALVCGSIQFSFILYAMDNNVLHLIEKLHKVKPRLGIKVTAWVGNPLMLNGIVYGRFKLKTAVTTHYLLLQ